MGSERQTFSPGDLDDAFGFGLFEAFLNPPPGARDAFYLYRRLDGEHVFLPMDQISGALPLPHLAGHPASPDTQESVGCAIALVPERWIFVTLGRYGPGFVVQSIAWGHENQAAIRSVAYPTAADLFRGAAWARGGPPVSRRPLTYWDGGAPAPGLAF